jgi:hypothetical protein
MLRRRVFRKEPDGMQCEIGAGGYAAHDGPINWQHALHMKQQDMQQCHGAVVEPDMVVIIKSEQRQ